MGEDGVTTGDAAEYRHWGRDRRKEGKAEEGN